MIQDTMLNGPYLLAPTSNSMTIVWETRVQINTNVFYEIQGQMPQKAEVCFYKETPCKDNTCGNFIYMAVIGNLNANTKYNYKIELESGEKANGEFKTLPSNPDRIKIFTISDSHLFYMNKQFENMVLENKPDFIIHGGDIPFGTGYQREQYENNWFKKIPKVLKTIPFIYIPGNHDDGPFYNDFFTLPQSKTYKCDETGRTFSFNYGNTHFLMVDSNSWGLFEMNAVDSGLPVDSKTKGIIHNTLNWMVNDLKSEAAQNANWRVLVLHHPYTDEFNNKHIVPIVERYNVNFVISGHLHYYIKNISINPEVGAKTVYITQGSVQDGESELDLGSYDKRLLAEFPEVVAIGRENYGCLNITKDKLFYQTFGFDSDKLGGNLVDEVTLTNEDPKIVISDIDITAIDNFGHVKITGKVRNEGTGIAAVTIKLNDNGTYHIINLFGNKDKERVIVLDPNEKKNFVAIYETKIPGQHQLCIENITKNIMVFNPCQLTFDHMKVKALNLKDGNLMNASVEVTNNLNDEVHVPVELFINKNVVETKTVGLKGHEKKLVEYYYKFLRGENYDVRIANLEEKKIRIQGAIRVIPKVKDLSGNCNNALLYGTPQIVKESDRVTIHLDNYSDYLEIPDSDSLHVSEGFTGMVWANINRLADDTEMSHNPLMVKGKSIGWGATYLLRMAVDRRGGLKWGTCYDITEYAWQGGNASLNKWVQYTSAFSKKEGGSSFCNGKKVASIPGIAKDTKLRNWENEPLFIGYSYIGHIIKEIDRPKYFTHLPAQISQVRFYRTKLSDKENYFIYKNPTKIGPKSDELVVWLDFNDIENTGIHITEWRRPAEFKPSYKTEKKRWHFDKLTINAAVPGKASLEAVVEVSDDGNCVKDSKNICIQNGTSRIDLSDLQQAQYIRVITKFTAEIGDKGTFIPELFAYDIIASIEDNFTNVIWSTRSDWEKGKLIGAIGFEPIDRLKVFDEYTDIIHG